MPEIDPATEAETSRNPAQPSAAPRDPPPDKPTKPSHVDLNDPWYKKALWTNDADELDLDTYFHPLRPNLGNQYGISNLRPVIKNRDEDSGQYLLMGGDNRFYSWNSNDGTLYRVKKTGLQPKEAAVMMVNGFEESELEQMFHPKIR